MMSNEYRNSRRALVEAQARQSQAQDETYREYLRARFLDKLAKTEPRTPERERLASAYLATL